MSRSSWLQARSFYLPSKASGRTGLKSLDVLLGVFMTLDASTRLSLMGLAYCHLKHGANALVQFVAFYYHDRITGKTYSQLQNLWSSGQPRRQAFLQGLQQWFQHQRI